MILLKIFIQRGICFAVDHMPCHGCSADVIGISMNFPYAHIHIKVATFFFSKFAFSISSSFISK